jgi:dipeptidyl aminopeptidase/acylaminoacyl peptidase
MSSSRTLRRLLLGGMLCVIGVTMLSAQSIEVPITQLTWFDRTGRQVALVGEPAAHGDLELSPDGRWAAVNLWTIPDRTLSFRIWVYDLEKRGRRRLSPTESDHAALSWSPDGSRVIYNMRNESGRFLLLEKRVDETGPGQALLEDGFSKWPMGWSPDGRFLLYSIAAQSSATKSTDLWVLPLTGDRKPFPYLQTPFSDDMGRLSPDGHWMAYVSNQSGRYEVSVAPFPGPGDPVPISKDGGSYPRWRRDGRELYYWRPDETASPTGSTVRATLVAVDVNGQGTRFERGTMRDLFSARVGRMRYPYDVSSDGQRFLVNRLVE